MATAANKDALHKAARQDPAYTTPTNSDQVLSTNFKKQE